MTPSEDRKSSMLDLADVRTSAILVWSAVATPFVVAWHALVKLVVGGAEMRWTRDFVATYVAWVVVLLSIRWWQRRRRARRRP
jgi:hypothetical protein